jgi:tetratricopeptide (TPR) repeat protein
MELLFPYPKMGNSFLEILQDPLTKKLLGFDAVHAEDTPFISGVSSRLKFLADDTSKHLAFLKLGYTALEAFLQANCTGPPLDFAPDDVVFPEPHRTGGLANIRQQMLQDLAVNGTAPYQLTPHIELFWLAKIILANPVLAEPGFNGRRARFRVNHWHQKLLSEKSDNLQELMYSDAEILEQQLHSRLQFGGAAAEEHFVEFLVERAQLRIYYGDDDKAREDLSRAATIRSFQFGLTGALGKRTKFQRTDHSQLVVLARSRDHEPEPYSSRKGSRAEPSSRRSSRVDANRDSPRSPTFGSEGSNLALRPLSPISPPSATLETQAPLPTSSPVQPANLPLNDDTLLERIQFKDQIYKPEMTKVSDQSTLPTRLTELDPAKQPLLFPMDSVILLATASSISNTSPADGLTREETLPYANRVLDGGSSNWQVYTQALLVRSRIEGYKSRTVERGLLQLQALVDQVIAETTRTPDKPTTDADTETSGPTSFLPKGKPSESATVAERLKYVYQISPPLRWELEAELAQRWTSMGGLKTALEIYERLQMHAEVALCLAATDREKEAMSLVRKLIFANPDAAEGTETVSATSPPDTARLLCILGDMTSNPVYYQAAWTHSKNTYSRAQRSLGRHYMKQRNFPAAAKAYKLVLERGRLDHATWFALGCVQLELSDFEGAVQSFQRCVMIEDQDAEAWSNLAVSLLRLPEPLADVADMQTQRQSPPPPPDDDPGSYTRPHSDPHHNKHLALRALRRSATLKRDDPRIWDNYLTVAASIPPSSGTPWPEIIQAMQRVVELRGKKEGEAAIDLKILKVVIDHVINEYPFPTSQDPTVSDNKELTGPSTDLTSPAPTSTSTAATARNPAAASGTDLPFVPRALLNLVDTHLLPLATTSSDLYLQLARLSLWRHRPAEALALHEKAWRAVTAKGNAYETQLGWAATVDATVGLVDAYRALGGLEREGTGAGQPVGKVEEKWRFKARTAVRGVLGKGRDVGEGSEGWERLQALGEELK